jgi:hypothetical protein
MFRINRIKIFRRILILMILVVVAPIVTAQPDHLFTKNDFRDVLISCKDAEFSGKKATVEFKGSKYEAVYDGMGNLNKLDPEIPLGDFKVEYCYSVTETDGKSGVGMSYMSTLKNSMENFVFNYMICPDGELWFYADKPEKYTIPLPEKAYAREQCLSIKKGNAVNYVSVMRKDRSWFLVINTDTVKRITEPAYKSETDNSDIEVQAPLLNYQSNVLLHKGKQKLEFISSSQTFYAISTELDKVASLLKNLTGSYSLSPDCKAGSTSYVFDIQVEYIQEGFDHKVLISGITSQPRYYYLKKNNVTGSWYCDLNEKDVIVYGGNQYKIKILNFLPFPKFSKISFKLELREMADNGYYLFDCDYSGSRRE